MIIWVRLRKYFKEVTTTGSLPSTVMAAVVLSRVRTLAIQLYCRRAVRRQYITLHTCTEDFNMHTKHTHTQCCTGEVCSTSHACTCHVFNVQIYM